MRSLLAIGAALALAAPAQAATPQTVRAQRIANTYYPVSCKVIIQVAPLDRETLAHADRERCTITFNRFWFKALRSLRDIYCASMAHEYGHLRLGPIFGGEDPWHSSDPESIMAANPVHMPMRCES